MSYCKTGMRRFSVDIITEESDQVEALNYEKESRLAVLKYIKDNGVDVPKELRELYIHDYVQFMVQFENTLDLLVRKYQKTKSRYTGVEIDFRTKKLTWLEDDVS